MTDAPTDDASERYRRLEQLRREVAKACQLPRDHDRVEAVAAMKFERELVIAQMVATGTPAGDRLTVLSKAIADMLPPLAEKPISVDVHFVEGISGTGECPHCHKQFVLGQGEWTKPPQPVPVIEQEVVAQPAMPKPAPAVTAEAPSPSQNPSSLTIRPPTAAAAMSFLAASVLGETALVNRAGQVPIGKP